MTHRLLIASTTIHLPLTHKTTITRIDLAKTITHDLMVNVAFVVIVVLVEGVSSAPTSNKALTGAFLVPITMKINTAAVEVGTIICNGEARVLLEVVGPPDMAQAQIPFRLHQHYPTETHGMISTLQQRNDCRQPNKIFHHQKMNHSLYRRVLNRTPIMTCSVRMEKLVSRSKRNSQHLWLQKLPRILT